MFSFWEVLMYDVEDVVCGVELFDNIQMCFCSWANLNDINRVDKLIKTPA